MRSLFRDADQTEFIIATIPTTLGVAESRRLLAALRSEGIPCRRLVVNQVGGSMVLKGCSSKLRSPCCYPAAVTVRLSSPSPALHTHTHTHTLLSACLSAVLPPAALVCILQRGVPAHAAA